MIFRYKIFDADNNIACTGETIQVFMNNDGVMLLNYPPFYEEWRKKAGLVK